MLENKRAEAVTEFCRRLIQTPSYSGQEKAVGEVLQAYMRAAGFDEISVDDYGNVIGCIKGKRKGRKILFDGHMDTVPVENEAGWTYSPFAAEIHDGKIYGRGATDMKGALAAMVSAAQYFAEDGHRDFSGEIYVAGVVHEECFEGIASRSISRKVEPDYVIIGEASNLNLKIGQRGRAELVLESFGKSCHSANPEKGVNAVYKMAAAIEAIRKISPPHHDVLGDGILELTDIKSLPYPGASVVPAYCRATYDRRLLLGETKESVLAPLQTALRQLMEQDRTARYKISYAVGEENCYTGTKICGERFFPGWLYRESEDFVQSIQQELRAMGFAPAITQYNFCTNGSHYAGEKHIKTIGMGPSQENIAHTVDEFIELEQLHKVTECYYGILTALLK